MFEFAEECSTSSAYESFEIGIEMCVRIIMVTLTFDSFLRSDRSSRIYNSHFSFLLLMVNGDLYCTAEIYTASF